MFGTHKAGAYGAVVILGLSGGILGPLGGLLGGSSDSGSTGGSSSASSARPSAAQWKDMGSTWSKWKRTLAKGCHNYAYTYTAKPPAAAGTQWSLETFLIGPRGGRLGSSVILGGADPKHGHQTWRICKSSTVPGKFTINAKLTYNINPDQYAGWVRTSHFRLVKP